MKRMCAAALVVTAALGVVTTGCGPHKQDEKQSGTDRGASAGSEQLRELTDAEQLRIADAQQRLIKGCMTREGFEFWEAERLSLEESRTLGWVTDDVAWANKYGYGSRIEAKHERARLTTDLSVQLSGLTLVDPCGTPWACDTRKAVVSPREVRSPGNGCACWQSMASHGVRRTR